MNVLLLLVLSATFLCVFGATTYNATISNSSGDYFISNDIQDLSGTSGSWSNLAEIICESSVLCHFQCNHFDSCNYAKIKCINAAQCIIDCIGSDTCRYGELHIGSTQTNIDCLGYSSCRGATVWTQSTGTAILMCGNNNACDELIFSGNGYNERFTILCKDADYSGCNLSNIPYQRPLVAPTMSNSSGEYYFDGFGSFVTVNCTDDCYIDCNGGSCKYSIIDCGTANICSISCQVNTNPDGALECQYMQIYGNNNGNVDIKCNGGAKVCENTEINIQNTEHLSVTFDSGYLIGYNMIFNIENVNNVEYNCFAPNGCGSQVLNVNRVDTFAAICSNYSCESMVFNVQNTAVIDFECDGSCAYINVMAHNVDNVELSCTYNGTGDASGYSCDDANICIQSYASFVLDCCETEGYYGCYSLSVCNETCGLMSSIYCGDGVLLESKQIQTYLESKQIQFDLNGVSKPKQKQHLMCIFWKHKDNSNHNN